ncbi:hypothetical protein [Streptomyces luteogriseus]|uniref:hypothetical protein n=1 Tax=Streptomyces luteogriseus TaxID=68233 RepID=UPI0037895C1F
MVGKGFDMYDIGFIAKDLDEGNYKDAWPRALVWRRVPPPRLHVDRSPFAVSAPTAGVGGLAVDATCFGIGYGAGELEEKAATSVLS